jgi:putative transcriptional regulator
MGSLTMAKTASKTERGVLGTVHKTAAGLHRAGVIDKATMREFDALCLTPVIPMAPEEIKALRKREQVSQPVFASYLNVRRDAVSKWERGEKRPDPSSNATPKHLVVKPLPRSRIGKKAVGGDLIGQLVFLQ